MSTRYRDGGATVTLTGDLEAWAERAIRGAAGDAVDVVRAELQTVANAAEAKWYGPQGVRRQTGRSGDMDVVTTIDAGRGIIRVSVGSTDTRTVGKRGAPLAAFVHRAKSTKTLLPEFVFKPGKAAIKAAIPRIAAIMAAKMSITNA
jgi:hypothetical protein